jgi:TrmH family RNA methyltransferase
MPQGNKLPKMLMVEDYSPITDLIHVVLVETQDSINIGNVARAMSNLGFRHLHLAAPRGWDIGRAKASGCGAEALLDSLHIHPDLPSALSDMEDVVAFSARAGKNRPAPTTLTSWVSDYLLTPNKRTALVFGPEDTGLTNEHLLNCGTVVRIPTSKENSSFNLSQAVLLALYELNRNRNDLAHPTQQFDAPNWSEQLQLGKIVDSVMWDTNFYRKETPHTIPGLVRQLIFRIKPDVRELAILLGMFSSVRSFIDRTKKMDKN